MGVAYSSHAGQAHAHVSSQMLISSHRYCVFYQYRSIYHVFSKNRFLLIYSVTAISVCYNCRKSIYLSELHDLYSTYGDNNMRKTHIHTKISVNCMLPLQTFLFIQEGCTCAQNVAQW